MTATTTSLLSKLLARGIPRPTAWEWAICPLPLTDAQVITEALTWHRAGLSDAQDVDWFLDGWRPEEAVATKLAGFTFEQARFVDTQLSRARDEHWRLGVDAPPVDSWTAWRSSSLMPDVVCLCVANGRHRVEDGRKLLAEIRRDPRLRGTLELQLACQGIDLLALS